MQSRAGLYGEQLDPTRSSFVTKSSIGDIWTSAPLNCHAPGLKNDLPTCWAKSGTSLICPSGLVYVQYFPDARADIRARRRSEPWLSSSYCIYLGLDHCIGSQSTRRPCEKFRANNTIRSGNKRRYVIFRQPSFKAVQPIFHERIWRSWRRARGRAYYPGRLFQRTSPSEEVAITPAARPTMEPTRARDEQRNTSLTIFPKVKLTMTPAGRAFKETAASNSRPFARLTGGRMTTLPSPTNNAN